MVDTCSPRPSSQSMSFRSMPKAGIVSSNPGGDSSRGSIVGGSRSSASGGGGSGGSRKRSQDSFPTSCSGHSQPIYSPSSSTTVQRSGYFNYSHMGHLTLDCGKPEMYRVCGAKGHTQGSYPPVVYKRCGGRRHMQLYFPKSFAALSGSHWVSSILHEPT